MPHSVEMAFGAFEFVSDFDIRVSDLWKVLLPKTLT